MSSREEMVRKVKEEYGLKSPRVLSVMLQIPREKFIQREYRLLAYEDRPINIGFGQTTSQPYTVAFMTDLLLSGLARRGHARLKVLEIGTGSGYQTAILAGLFKKVYSLEIIPQLAKRARKKIRDLGLKNVFIKQGSGEWGWKEHAPYEAIIITAGVEKVPQALFKQLKIDGALVVPVGKVEKIMTRFIKTQNGKLKTKTFGVFSFVPFVIDS